MNEIINRIKATDQRELTDAQVEELLNDRMRQASAPNMHTAAFAQAVADWNRQNGYNGQVVPYLEMTADQRADVLRRQMAIVAGGR